MTDIRKVSFTLPGGATFNAEGTEEYVDKLLAQFTTLMQAAPATVTNRRPLPGVENGGGTPPPQDLPLDRLFSQDDFYGVALLAMPKTTDEDADGILALLYGFAVLKKESTVSAIKLQRAAEKSGLSVPRLNRVVARHSQFITESGAGKGKRYGLNNPGMTKAVEILSGILG